MGKLPWYKRWIRRILFDICWSLGDALLGWSLKFADGPFSSVEFISSRQENRIKELEEGYREILRMPVDYWEPEIERAKKIADNLMKGAKK